MSKHKVIDLISKIGSLEGNDDLRAIINKAHDRLDYLSRVRARDFVIGEEVEFDGKRGHMKGTVKKINIKYVVVDVYNPTMPLSKHGSWRVPASMLKKVA